jgi:ubiquinone/menaquinone biosynthesis C-methylase UbiE
MADRDELSQIYQDYARRNLATGRWSTANPGNRLLLEERAEALEELLEGAGLLGRPIEVLDVGCGSATLLPAEVEPRRRIGIDLLSERLHLALEAGIDAVACADGAALPFPDGCFDLVVLSTVLSSVPDRSTREHIGSEATRVLREGGAVAWYDMRAPNPANRNISRVGRRELRRIFPDLVVQPRSTTLVPQIARRLGDHPRLYRWLSALRVTRSHLIGVFTKAASPPKDVHRGVEDDATSPPRS